MWKTSSRVSPHFYQSPHSFVSLSCNSTASQISLGLRITRDLAVFGVLIQIQRGFDKETLACSRHLCQVGTNERLHASFRVCQSSPRELMCLSKGALSSEYFKKWIRSWKVQSFALLECYCNSGFDSPKQLLLEMGISSHSFRTPS